MQKDGTGVLIPLLHTSQPGSLGIVQTGQKNKNGGKDIFSLKIRLPEHWTPAATLIPAVTTTDNS